MQIDWMQIVFNLIGGVGIFLYGMKVMSTGMQQLAGARIKRYFEILTNNRLMGVLVGMTVTAIIQSSSATTVMVIGFINAGLMELGQAVGIIMGANIGTTITAWIIAIKITKYALPMIAVGAVMHLFLKNHRVNNWGQIILGLGMLFFGLTLMSEAFKPLRNDEQFLQFFAQFGAANTLQIAKSALAGMLLTMIVQSSSATIGITMALAMQGLITYEGAAALVLGENIGTTITMQLASIGANTASRRAANVHSIFNVIGVCYMILVFPWYIRLVDFVIPGDMNSVAYIGAHIAAGHSIFNIINTIIFLPLAGFLVKIASWMSSGKKIIEEKHLQYIDYSFISTPSIAIGQAKREIIKMASMTTEMFKWSEDMLFQPTINQETADRLFKYENITDALQTEISKFLAELLQHSPGPEDAEDARRYLRIADEYESVGDMCELIAKYCIRKQEQNISFSVDAMDGLSKVYKEIYEYIELCTRCFIEEKPRIHHEADSKSKSITKMIKHLRNDHIDRLDSGQCNVVYGLLYSDILSALQNIRAHSHNIAETVAGLK